MPQVLYMCYVNEGVSNLLMLSACINIISTKVPSSNSISYRGSVPHIPYSSTTKPQKLFDQVLHFRLILNLRCRKTALHSCNDLFMLPCIDIIQKIDDGQVLLIIPLRHSIKIAITMLDAEIDCRVSILFKYKVEA